MAAFWSSFVLVLLQWSGLSIWRSAQTAKIASTASTVVPQMITRTQIRRLRLVETPSARPGLAPAGLPAGVGGGAASAGVVSLCTASRAGSGALEALLAPVLTSVASVVAPILPA